MNNWVGGNSENLNFAAGVAAYGMLLRQSPYAGTADYTMASTLVQNNHTFDPYGYRAKLQNLINKASELGANK